MEQPREWRFEVNNPQESRHWRKLWDIDDDQLEAAQELRNNLNKTIAPVLIRIARTTGF